MQISLQHQPILWRSEWIIITPFSSNIYNSYFTWLIARISTSSKAIIWERLQKSIYWKYTRYIIYQNANCARNLNRKKRLRFHCLFDDLKVNLFLILKSQGFFGSENFECFAKISFECLSSPNWHNWIYFINNLIRKKLEVLRRTKLIKKNWTKIWTFWRSQVWAKDEIESFASIKTIWFC